MKTRLALAVAALVGTLSLGGGFIASAQAVNPNLGAKSHGHFDNGKALPHVSGGTEVTFDEERALGADAASAAASDLPPDATVSALGCANRGSQTNPRVNQDCTSRRQAEEQVAVNPVDPTNVIAGQNDSRIGFNHCGYDYSLNSGSSFGDGLPPFFQHVNPGTGHTYDAASDPNVTFNGAGVAWYSCVLFDVNSNASGLFAVPSTAALKGSAYANVPAGASKYVVAETNDGHTFYDKQFMAGDPRPGAKSVYVTFTVFTSDQKCSTGNNPGAYCSSEIFYSKWDGAAQKWSPIANVSGSSPLCTGGNTFNKKAAADACNFDQGSMPVVNPSDGSVFVTWSNGNTPTALNQQLGRRIDADGTMGPVVKVGQDDERNLALCDFGRGPEECVKSLNVRTNDFPAIAVDPSNPNHLVTVWQDTRNGTGAYNVVVSDSNDGGQTWSDAAGGGTVVAGAPGAALSQPSVAVTQTGTTAVSFYNANPYTGTAVGGGTFGYGMVSRGSGSTTFSSYRPLSDGQAYPSPQANASQAGFLGDYSSIAASTAPGSNLVHAVWSDTRNSSAAGPDEDVFMATAAP
ncbi:hypothetical protein SCMU_11760 [Sinomonas cyclohexanicum]|uniref:Exo-alpha-sialidase n=1 Tax=Sinomonas cyclohexanicum TaxID=322009 RepID=A0ABN6FFB9_SINCY|nr:hypothetical protein [Corynebacterium cyclohexanicum]BCT75334.1 hypothetical protein SCMU_11760 [Corynebacterium cyclohexanicum]